MGVTSAAASQMLERLVQQGLVLRMEDPGDRRAKKLVLTEKGKHTIQEVSQARQKWMEGLVQSLTQEEKEQITAALNLLVDKIEQTDHFSADIDAHP
jgi:DNA-binding MarR family transcriptional regulator